MYKAQTFNWSALYSTLRSTIADITGLDLTKIVMDYSQIKQSYPYVTLSNVTKSRVQASSIGTREREIADYQLTINCFSENGAESMQMADDIQTLLMDRKNKNKLHEVGAVIDDVMNNSGYSDSVNGLFNVSASSLRLSITIYRNYFYDDNSQITNVDIKEEK